MAMGSWMMMGSHKDSPGVGWSNKDDIAMGFGFCKKSGLELMHNCDLPPPLKVFSGVSPPPPMDKYGSIAALEDMDGEKLELLKALRLSQTRAREAERRLEGLSKERETLSDLLLKESLRLIACRNSVRLLELQVSQLEKHHQSSRFTEDKGDTDSTWFIAAMALCLAFGCTYYFLV